MKKVFFLLSLAALAYGSTSCKKCIECSYPVGGGVRTQEICGSTTAVDNGKAFLKPVPTARKWFAWINNFGQIPIKKGLDAPFCF